MALRLNGQTTGYTELNAPDNGDQVVLTMPGNDGDAGQYLQTNGSGTLSWQTVTDTNTQITRNTSASLSSSGIIFSPPSGVRRITVAFWGVSTDGNDFGIRLGDSGGIANSDYLSWAKRMGGSAFTTGGSSTYSAFTVGSSAAAASTYFGQAVLLNVTGNDWLCESTLVDQSDNMRLQCGRKSLSAELTHVSIEMIVSGSFDAGSANIFYES